MSINHLGIDPSLTLYDPAFEHDACGTGFVADVAGRPSHRVVQAAIESVVNLTHRGAVAADAKTGDGAGILTPLPRRLIAEELARAGLRADPADLGVGMLFLPRDPAAAARARALIRAVLAETGLTEVLWRTVPVDSSALGEKASQTQPQIEQVYLGRSPAVSLADFERTLYRARKRIEKRAVDDGLTDLYIPSFSSKTVVYKGLFVAPQLQAFYLDLQNPAYEAALAVFHQRYSTNTFPNWFLAQPFHLLAHNGEINTLQGNRNWMRARETGLESPLWNDRIADLAPVIWEDGSDSASLDNALELYQLSGRDVLHAMMMLIPEAWENMPDMDPQLRAFYEYHACLTEPWDGPAAIAFSDGDFAAAVLDRNGLRPARYKITDDGLVVMASEVGVVDLDDAHVVEKGRLGPGQMIAVDTVNHRVLRNDDIKQYYASRKPYQEWLDEQLSRMPSGLAALADDTSDPMSESSIVDTIDRYYLNQEQLAFGFTHEELKFVLEPMSVEGKEPVWSMGDDAPHAILSQKPRTLSNFFRQRFAQVTNPPIDPLRETIVMSLDCYLGRRRSALLESPEHARLLHLRSPLLSNAQLEAIASLEDPSFQAVTIPALFDATTGPDGLSVSLDVLCADAIRAVDAGKTILIVSDRGVDDHHAPIPMLLAVSAIHHHLIRSGRRMQADLICETGQAWDVHQFALLLGYGASAINPYLAMDSIAAMVVDDEAGITLAKANKYFHKAVEDGILKIMSKMGITPLASYRGAQIFECVGLNADLVQQCFPGTPSRIRGIGLREIAEDSLARHTAAFVSPSPEGRLPDFGFYRFRRDGEYHAYNPSVIRAIQKAANSGEYADYKAYSELIANRAPATLRDLLDFRPHQPIPLDEVESVEAIRRRFTSQAMSLGALGPEAHQTISIAMNRIGSRSNTGEGGEDPSWYGKSGGDSPDNKTKQIASARFGVTTEYIAHAHELEIKMAQGSKPGEGGQLPAHKVSAMIAKFRHAIPGIPLISPAPHHDIYSIEDLAQLIYDLKQTNPRAKVGVKLVSETGVGTIAAGVAKAYADYILISGMDGGTGASPLSSIKGAGCPWEIGLSETQQVLVLNDLRGRVMLRVDGGFKTGRDVVIGAMLGAEEFGFGTASIVSIGCDMARQCHLNTCPTGIATQRADLRAKFKGRPEQLINFLTLVAEEVREILASLGIRRLDDVIGRVDLLTQVAHPATERAGTLDLSQILADVDPSGARPRMHAQERNDRPDQPLDLEIMSDLGNAMDGGRQVHLEYAIRNSNRTVGARIAGEIAHRYGNNGLPEGAIDLRFTGTAGQSFGAFCTGGMRLTLVGEANDYVAKGMSGGTIVIHPSPRARYDWQKNIIIGNTVLYGATAGRLFAAGRAGERFAVRNSGAHAVVEGCGDHGCEYMTAGVVVVLGETGRNFAAGMSAGTAYVLDESGDFPRKLNSELVSLERVVSPADVALLRGLISEHVATTGSAHARQILAALDDYLPRFWKVVPHPPIVATEGKDAHGVVAVHHSAGHGRASHTTDTSGSKAEATNGSERKPAGEEPEAATSH